MSDVMGTSIDPACGDMQVPGHADPTGCNRLRNPTAFAFETGSHKRDLGSAHHDQRNNPAVQIAQCIGMSRACDVLMTPLLPASEK
jgi:hypothetical protein